MTEPLVSVIVPVYNVLPYVRQALDSVVGQTYRNLDIVVVDDGSTDGSGDVCDEYAARDARVRVVHTENRGLSAVRNLGVREARGEFLMTVDSDDWLEPSAVDEMLSIALRHDADLVCASCFREYVGRSIAPTDDRDDVRVLRGGDNIPAYADGLLGEAAWNKLYRTDVLEGIRYPEDHVYEDVHTTWQIVGTLAAAGGAAAITGRPLVHHRSHAGSITSDKSLANCQDAWQSYRARYEGLSGLGVPMRSLLGIPTTLRANHRFVWDSVL